MFAAGQSVLLGPDPSLGFDDLMFLWDLLFLIFWQPLDCTCRWAGKLSFTLKLLVWIGGLGGGVAPLVLVKTEWEEGCV